METDLIKHALDNATLEKLSEIANISSETKSTSTLEMKDTTTEKQIDKFGVLSFKVQALRDKIEKRKEEFKAKMQPLTLEFENIKEQLVNLKTLLSTKISSGQLDINEQHGINFGIKKRMHPISRYVSPEQKKKFVAKLKEGDKSINFLKLIEDYKVDIELLKNNPHYKDYVKAGMVEENRGISISAYPIK